VRQVQTDFQWTYRGGGHRRLPRLVRAMRRGRLDSIECAPGTRGRFSVG
jgi:hypothetical protein